MKNRKVAIQNKWKTLMAASIILIILLLVIMIVREYYLFQENLQYVEQELLEKNRNAAFHEVMNRLDEINYIKESYQDEYKLKLKEKVLGINLLAEVYLNNLPEDTNLEEKRKIFVDFIYQYDLKDEDYLYFAMDLEGNSYLSGLTKNLEGTNILHLVDDVTGEYFVETMIDVINNSETGDGYISYHWIKEVGGEHLLKTSYILYNPEVELFFGTGLYEEDNIETIKTKAFETLASYYKHSKEYIYILLSIMEKPSYIKMKTL